MFSENCVNEIVYMTAPNIHAVHAFTTRFGGVSSGIFASLNLGLGLGDDLGSVKENYERICGALQVSSSSLVRSSQVHGASIRTVYGADCGGFYSPPCCEADGMITRDAGVTLIVYSADCVPILLHDPCRGVFGAVHAGWRGTAANAVGAAVRKMAAEFGCVPADIKAAVGPCISKCCYEIGQEVSESLRLTLGSEAENCLSTLGGRIMADLSEANRILLLKAGLWDITASGECTSCLGEKYWSHRRTKGQRGSQAAVIYSTGITKP